MTVMQVRPNYSIVYQFKPLLRLESESVETEKHFVSFIKDVSKNWRDGDYFFRCSEGTFAYFTLNGNRVKLSKKSRMGKEYLCWQYFAEPVKKKRKAVAKTVTKRKVKKKVAVKVAVRKSTKKKKK